MANRCGLAGVLVLALSLSTTCLAQSGEGSAAVPAGMVLIPDGSFRMGDSLGEGHSDERPVHTVSVSAFYMDAYEVTKGLWDEVTTWAQTHGYEFDAASGYGKASNHPVHIVTWYGSVKWANARSEKEGLTPCYTVGGSVYRSGYSDNVSCNWSANGYRLPTEAEWEKAARGGCDGHRFPWCGADTITHSRANYESTRDYSYDTSPTRSYHPTYKTGSMPYTSPVGSFPANRYGLYDMAGNVFEWCWDWYSETYYASSPGTDPSGPASGLVRVCRGGGWYDHADSCCVANRYISLPRGSYGIGFRLVRTAPYGTRASSYTPPAYTPPVYTPPVYTPPVYTPPPPPNTLSTSDMQVWWSGEGQYWWEDYLVVEGTVSVANSGSIEAENCECEITLVSDGYIIDSDRKWAYDIRAGYYDWWAFRLAGDVEPADSLIYIELECDNLEGTIVKRDRL